MKCQFCKADNDRVVDTRSCDGGTIIRRRRECLSCGRRFTSNEIVEEVTVSVIKKSGEKETFDIQKVLRSVEIACRKRPITGEQIKELADRVERRSLEAEDKEISTKIIGDFIMKELKKLDAVAYVRFSSVYRDYQDIDQFVKAINSIKGR